MDNTQHDRHVTMSELEIRNLSKNVVHETLLSLGIDASNPIETQEHFKNLKDLKDVDINDVKDFIGLMRVIRNKGILTFVGLFVAGMLSLLLVGMKDFFK